MHIVSSIWNEVNLALTDDIKLLVFYTGKKLSTCFNIKDNIVFNHEHDIVYYGKFSEKSFSYDYLGEWGRREIEQVKDHNGRDTSSHIFKHCLANYVTNVLQFGSKMYCS